MKGRLRLEKGFITLNGKRYSELNWFEMFVYNTEVQILRKQNELLNT